MGNFFSSLWQIGKGAFSIVWSILRVLLIPIFGLLNLLRRMLRLG